MDKERFLSSGLLEQYVLGLTSPAENREVERYLNAFPELRKEVKAMRNALEQYAMEQSVPPPRRTKSKILSEIDALDQKQGTQQGGRASSKGWIVTLSLIGVLALGFLSTMLYQQKRQYQKDYNKMQAEYAMFRESCEAKQAQLAQSKAIYAFFQHADTQPVKLKGTDLSPSSQAIVYWNEEEKRAYFNPVNMPPAPAGKQYQLWADVDGEMINMGLIAKDAEAQLQLVTFIENAESLNITLEPEGGSEAPNVQQLYVNGKV